MQRAKIQPQRILLVESGEGSVDALATLAGEIGVEVIVVPHVDAAVQAIASAQAPISAVFLSTAIAVRQQKKAVKAIRAAGPAAGLHFVSIGAAPTRSERRALRSAGLEFALWGPIDESALRFQLNRARDSAAGQPPGG